MGRVHGASDQEQPWDDETFVEPFPEEEEEEWTEPIPEEEEEEWTEPMPEEEEWTEPMPEEEEEEWTEPLPVPEEEWGMPEDAPSSSDDECVSHLENMAQDCKAL